jgi:hypothetical protein
MESREKVHVTWVPCRHGMARPHAAGAGNGIDTWRNETIGCSRELHNEELHNLYSSVNILRIITLTRMRWALVRKAKGAYRDFVGEAEVENNKENINVDGMIILKWILNTYSRMVWTEFI